MDLPPTSVPTPHSSQGTKETINTSSPQINTQEDTSPWEARAPTPRTTQTRSPKSTTTHIFRINLGLVQTGSERRHTDLSSAILIPSTTLRKWSIWRRKKRTPTTSTNMVPLILFRNQLQAWVHYQGEPSLPSQSSSWDQSSGRLWNIETFFQRKQRFQGPLSRVPRHIDIQTLLRLIPYHYSPFISKTIIIFTEMDSVSKLVSVPLDWRPRLHWNILKICFFPIFLLSCLFIQPFLELNYFFSLPHKFFMAATKFSHKQDRTLLFMNSTQLYFVLVVFGHPKWSTRQDSAPYRLNFRENIRLYCFYLLLLFVKPIKSSAKELTLYGHEC